MVFEIECQCQNILLINKIKEWRFRQIEETANKKFLFQKFVNREDNILNGCLTKNDGILLTSETVGNSEFRKLWKHAVKGKGDYSVGVVLSQKSMDFLRDLAGAGSFVFRFYDDKDPSLFKKEKLKMSELSSELLQIEFDVNYCVTK